MIVYLVYTIYQYDGLDKIEVYDSESKAVEAANRIVDTFLEKDYGFADGYEDFSSFDSEMIDNSSSVTLGNESGEVRIEVEKKLVQ